MKQTTALQESACGGHGPVEPWWASFIFTSERWQPLFNAMSIMYNGVVETTLFSIYTSENRPFARKKNIDTPLSDLSYLLNSLVKMMTSSNKQHCFSLHQPGNHSSGLPPATMTAALWPITMSLISRFTSVFTYLSSDDWLKPAVRFKRVFIRSSSSCQCLLVIRTDAQRWTWFTLSAGWSGLCFFCCCGQIVRVKTRNSTTWLAAHWSNCSIPDTTSAFILTMSNTAQVTFFGAFVIFSPGFAI